MTAAPGSIENFNGCDWAEIGSHEQEMKALRERDGWISQNKTTKAYNAEIDRNGLCRTFLATFERISIQQKC